MKRVDSRTSVGSSASRIRPASVELSRRLRPMMKRKTRQSRYVPEAMSSPSPHSAISGRQCNRCSLPVMLLDALDLGATFVFAISGATQGVRKRLDLFGVLVVAWAAGVAGGIARDLLIGAVPPAAIAHWRYFAITIAAGLVGFFASAQIARLKMPVQLFDAAGLCLFAVTGTEKALAYGLNPLVAAVLGMVTCIGGG